MAAAILSTRTTLLSALTARSLLSLSAVFGFGCAATSNATDSGIDTTTTAAPGQSREIAYGVSRMVVGDIDINQVLFVPHGTRRELENCNSEHIMTQTTATPHITLNNGVELPALGLGVFQSSPEDTVGAVEAAIRIGYRLIDTAAAYANEREVGEGIRRAGISRDEMFIETKVWISDYGYDATLHAFEKSAKKLGVEQLDLLILHQPLPSAFDRTLEAYRALEKLLDDKRVRAIGVSNFMPEHLDRLMKVSTVVPAVNQVEVHPYFQQARLQQIHKQHGITTQAWSPIGGITSYRGMERRSFDDPTLLEIARKKGKSPAQVMLRWHLQEGRSAIPKSVHTERIAENFDVFDFELTSEEVAAIDALDTGVRGGPEPETITLESFGRPIPEA